MSSVKISVLFPAPLDCFDYESNEPVPAGTVVEVPFRKSVKKGVVWTHESKKSYHAPLKKIQNILPFPPLPENLIKFIEWVALYNCIPLGSALSLAFSSEFFKESKKPLLFQKASADFCPVQFTEEQQKVLDELLPDCQKGFQPCLLQGVTGSGKTEVYFEAIAEKLSQQILVLLPEINLTSAWKERFQKRFGSEAAYWHSGMTPKQKRDTFQAVLTGKVQVVVGARSALFLPFKNLSLIIVDEEHDSSYKQEDGACYHARDMAVLRAKIENIPIILASATPSLETYANVVNGKYHRFKINQRYAQAELPDISLIDMKKEKTPTGRWISPTLEKEIKESLSKKEQVLLFLNRRGYAPIVLCRNCGEKLECPHCASALVEHLGQTENRLICHHCGYSMKRPEVCPKCQSELVSCGPGVERIEQEAKFLFPEANVVTLTSDTISSAKNFEELSAKINQDKIDILIGTQILAKGHNFPNLTLVGIIDADLGLEGSDLRAAERSFQLLSQVSGRAGRYHKKGKAFLQTYHPDCPLFALMKEDKQEEFLKEELHNRQILNMPPYSKLVGLIFSAKNKEFLLKTVKSIASSQPYSDKIDIYGPAPAPLFMLRGQYRYRFLLKTPKNFQLQELIEQWILPKLSPRIRFKIDVDPYSFL